MKAYHHVYVPKTYFTMLLTALWLGAFMDVSARRAEVCLHFYVADTNIDRSPTSLPHHSRYIHNQLNTGTDTEIENQKFTNITSLKRIPERSMTLDHPAILLLLPVLRLKVQ